MADELDREHQPVAPPPGGGETPPPLAGHSPGRGSEHGLRGGAGGVALPARDTRPDRATRFLATTRGVPSCSQVAPWLAERDLPPRNCPLPAGIRLVAARRTALRERRGERSVDIPVRPGAPRNPKADRNVRAPDKCTTRVRICDFSMATA